MKRIVSIIFSLAVLFTAMAQRIYMTGDSHVDSRIYPRSVEQLLRQRNPDIAFGYSAKIGASFHTFIQNDFALLKPALNFNPDILIIHLGTNDSYSFKFNREVFLKNVQQVYDKVQQDCSECQIVFVTPFYNKLKQRGKWVVNSNAAACSDAIVFFAATHPYCLVIDNNADHGFDFIDERLIRNDNVHLSADGYKALGEQVGLGLLSIRGLI